MDVSYRKTYPGDVSDDGWAFVVPYLTLMTEAAGQRKYALREHDVRELLRVANGRSAQPPSQRALCWHGRANVALNACEWASCRL